MIPTLEQAREQSEIPESIGRHRAEHNVAHFCHGVGKCMVKLLTFLKLFEKETRHISASFTFSFGLNLYQ